MEMSVPLSGSALARQAVVEIADSSGVAEARRAAAALAALARLDDNACGELALAMTEAGGNILKHAQRGRILVRVIERDRAFGVEVLAIDRGPGMANVAESMRDGHSTAGSPGTGMGALQRMTTGFEIWSQPGKGTIARFEVWSRAPAASPRALPAGAISLPKAGEEVCGDAWTLVQGRGRLVLLVVDGLGHGRDAAVAARAAVAAAERNAARNAAELLETVHAALRPTRGAAAAVMLLQPESELCTICGVGNIAAMIRSAGRTRSMVSHNGTLGHQVHKMQEFSYPFPRGSLLIAHTDGIATHWDLAAYPGLEARHPAIVAAALCRDFDRGRDDLTVVALRNGP
jgi:anti-sigma regulatory factor (Ser/Thr protein kinase)